MHTYLPIPPYTTFFIQHMLRPSGLVERCCEHKLRSQGRPRSARQPWLLLGPVGSYPCSFGTRGGAASVGGLTLTILHQISH
jgi:hypothetical protein